MTDWDAVVVAGGAGSRLGGASKPELMVGGSPLLDRALDAVAGARSVVTVGGPQRPGVLWTVEEPAGSGPAAALAAGLSALGSHPAPWTVVLGVDTPRAAEAVPLLLAARSGAPDGAWVVDASGEMQPLLAIYRTSSLAARCDGDLAGSSLRRLVTGLAMVPVADPGGLSRDLDTWEDAQFWKERLG